MSLPNSDEIVDLHYYFVDLYKEKRKFNLPSGETVRVFDVVSSEEDGVQVQVFNPKTFDKKWFSGSVLKNVLNIQNQL